MSPRPPRALTGRPRRCEGGAGAEGVCSFEDFAMARWTASLSPLRRVSVGCGAAPFGTKPLFEGPRTRVALRCRARAADVRRRGPRGAERRGGVVPQRDSPSLPSLSERPLSGAWRGCARTWSVGPPRVRALRWSSAVAVSSATALEGRRGSPAPMSRGRGYDPPLPPATQGVRDADFVRVLAPAGAFVVPGGGGGEVGRLVRSRSPLELRRGSARRLLGRATPLWRGVCFTGAACARRLQGVSRGCWRA